MKDSAFLFALGLIPQVDYATFTAGTTAPKNYAQIIQTDRQPANYEPVTSNDEGYSTGTPYPTENLIEAHEVTKVTTERMSSQLLGRRALAAFGAVVSSTQGSGKKHIFTPLNPQTASQLPVYPYAEKLGTLHNYRAASLLAESFSVVGEGKSFVQATTNWRGSGDWKTPSGINFDGVSRHVVLQNEQTHNHFRNTSARLKIFANPDFDGDVLEVLCDFRSFNFSLNNNPLLEQGYLGCGKYQDQANPESGAIRGSLEIGTQQVTCEYILLMSPDVATTFNPFGKARLQSYFSTELLYQGSQIGAGPEKHQALFRFARQVVSAVAIAPIEGLAAYRVTAQPLALGQQMPVTLEVINDVASYTAL
jgi:hypothetical protein